MRSSPAVGHLGRLFLAAVAITGVACDRDLDGVYARRDCDDRDPDRYPGNDEICDDIDNDCDFEVDENLTATWYLDADRDGRGSGSRIQQCGQPDGYSRSNDDCDDNNAAVHPGRAEVCDGADNDCDGFVDVDGNYDTLYYPDLDSDGQGDLYASEVSCVARPGFAAGRRDCDDNDGNVAPSAPETCDGRDTNCDGIIDNVPGGGCE